MGQHGVSAHHLEVEPVLGLILRSGSCLCAVTHLSPMSMWGNVPLGTLVPPGPRSHASLWTGDSKLILIVKACTWCPVIGCIPSMVCSRYALSVPP